jgi:hypothetical protein
MFARRSPLLCNAFASKQRRPLVVEAQPPRCNSEFRTPMSPAALSGKNGRKLVHKLSKNVMKSRRIRIPKYDMPIRLRPVSITPRLVFRHLTYPDPAVVPCLHMHCYGCSRFSGLHQFLSSFAVERQAVAFSVFLPGYRCVLFYHRRGRVSECIILPDRRLYI